MTYLTFLFINSRFSFCMNTCFIACLKFYFRVFTCIVIVYIMDIREGENDISFYLVYLVMLCPKNSPDLSLSVDVYDMYFFHLAGPVKIFSLIYSGQWTFSSLSFEDYLRKVCHMFVCLILPCFIETTIEGQ